MFLDSGNFPFTALIEARSQGIRREFEQLSSQQLMSWPETNLYNRGWKVFGLWAMGQRLVANCQACPMTAEAVETIPQLTTAGFSIMGPGTRIRPHVGYTGSVLRCHLGLIVPENCGIQVGEETRRWKEGKCLVFDDTVIHSAWNDSGQTRVILLIDFLRPDQQLEARVPDAVADAIRFAQKDR